MFHNSHSMFHGSHSPRTSHVLFLIALIFTTCLATAPVFAADPEEIDPDPGFADSSDSVTRVLILSDPAELDTDRLAPGRYFVRIVDGGRTTAIYEIVVDGR